MRWKEGKKAWWAHDPSIGLAKYPDHGFGAISPHICENCGPIWEEPTAYISKGSTMWSPAEYALPCPSCGKLETIYENDAKCIILKQVRRYRRTHETP